MSTLSRSRIAYLFFTLGVLALGLAGVHHLMTFTSGGTVPREQYYRSVYVLQSMGGPAAQEDEPIPAGVIRMDETESMLHHPDRILVLRRVAEDLEALVGEIPRALLFAAYARLALGEKARAADLLAGYVVENPYRAEYYALLCGTLDELADYSTLLMMAKEWQERDPRCSEDRSRLIWSALYNLGRYAEAEAFLRTQTVCLGWRAKVFAAKSAFAEGREATAEDLLDQAVERYPDEAYNIRRLWEQMKTRSRV